MVICTDTEEPFEPRVLGIESEMITLLVHFCVSLQVGHVRRSTHCAIINLNAKKIDPILTQSNLTHFG